MKRRFLIIAGLAALAVLALAACDSLNETIAGSGNVVDREERVADFAAVEAGSAFGLTITRSAVFSVIVSADDNILDRIEVVRSGDRLVIRLESGLSVSSATLRVEIEMPELRGLRLSGASRATVTDFQSSDNLDIGLSGASRLEGDIGAGDADIDLSGASRITLDGSARRIKVRLSGASTLDFTDFPVDRAELTLSGASAATVDVRKELGPVRLSGASRLTYFGNPTIKNLNSSGASTIESR